MLFLILKIKNNNNLIIIHYSDNYLLMCLLILIFIDFSITFTDLYRFLNDISFLFADLPGIDLRGIRR